MPTVTVSGTELYYEIRGTGPPVLLIMGSTGDGAHFDALAELGGGLGEDGQAVLTDEQAHRRGNGGQRLIVG